MKIKVYILDKPGIEKMFTESDVEIFHPANTQGKNTATAIGKGKKILVSRNFFEKVKNEEITTNDLSQIAKNNFEKVFDFIDKNFEKPKNNS